MKIITAAILSLLIASSSFADEAGARLYKKLIDRYQGLASYQDEGKAIYYLGEDKSKQTVLFKTHFSDPNLIRFEFTKHHPYFLLKFSKWKYVIWHDGEKSYISRDGEIEEREKVTSVFASATGISSGIAPKVPSLLMDRGIGAGIHRLVDPELGNEKEIDDRLCHHLKVKRRNGDLINIWISKEDMLIRRIEEDGTEINYDSIRVNEELPKTVFQLNPKK